MVYESQLQEISTARSQLEQQRQQLLSQKTMLENPNILRRSGYGYLLGPAGKPTRIQAIQQVQSGLGQLQQFETEQLNPAEAQIRAAKLNYEEQLRQYEEAKAASNRQAQDFSRSIALGNVYGTKEFAVKQGTETVQLPTGTAYVSPTTGKIYGSFADLYKAEYKAPKSLSTEPSIQISKETRSFISPVTGKVLTQEGLQKVESVLGVSNVEKNIPPTISDGTKVYKYPGTPLNKGSPIGEVKDGKIHYYDETIGVVSSINEIAGDKVRPFYDKKGNFLFMIPESYFHPEQKTTPKPPIIQEVIRKAFGIPIQKNLEPVVTIKTIEPQYLSPISMPVVETAPATITTSLPPEEKSLTSVLKDIKYVGDSIGAYTYPSTDINFPDVTIKTIKSGGLTTQQTLPGVTVVDFGKTEGGIVTKTNQGMSTAFTGTQPTPADIILQLSGVPTFTTQQLQSNALFNYLAGLKPSIPIGKPAEPLPPISFDTFIQRSTDLALNLPPTQVLPYAIKGYDFAKPYVQQYVQENPFVQAITFSHPVKAGKEQIQTFAEVYAPDIKKRTGLEIAPYLIGSTAELIPTTPIGVIGTVGIVGAGSAVARAAPRLLTAADIAIGGVGAYQVATATTPEQEAAGIINIGVGGLGLTAEGVQYLRTPVELARDIKPLTTRTTQEAVASILKGEQLAGTEATFTLQTQTPPRYAYYSTKGGEFLRKISGVSPESFGKKEVADLTFEELQFLAPRGKLVEIAPPRASISYLPPSLVKEGQIQSFIKTETFTPTRTQPALTEPIGIFEEPKLGKIIPGRKQPEVFSGFLGRTEEPRTLRLIDEAKLDKITLKNLETIQKLAGEKVTTKNPFAGGELDITSQAIAKKTFFPETELTKGEVLTYDLFKKYGTGKIGIIPSGGRTRMGTLASVEKSVAKAEFTDREFGLKEYEKFVQSFSFVDTTYPRVPRIRTGRKTLFELIPEGIEVLPSEEFISVKPKVAQGISGVSERFLFELPPETEGTRFVRGERRPLTVEEQSARQETLLKLSEQIQQSQREAAFALKKAEVAAALGYKAPRIRSSAVILKQLGFQEYPTIVGGAGAVSTFTGLGIYEQTIGGTLPKELPKEISKEVPSEVVRDIVREVPREINREVAREVARDVTREIPKEIPKEIQREIPRLVTREIIRTVPKQVAPIPSSILVPLTERGIIKGPIKKTKELSRKKRRISPAYSVLLKRGRTFYPIAKGLPRGRALQFGAGAVQRELSRQFKLVKSGETTEADIAFRPSPAAFRTYRQRRGIKESLDADRFIQRTSNALSSAAEKSLIQQARRRKRK